MFLLIEKKLSPIIFLAAATSNNSQTSLPVYITKPKANSGKKQPFCSFSCEFCSFCGAGEGGSGSPVDSRGASQSIASSGLLCCSPQPAEEADLWTWTASEWE